MHILFVNRMASMERGGGETFDLEMSRHLQKLDCQVSFLSGIPLFGLAKLPIDHAQSFTIRTPYSGWFPWDKVRGGWRLRLADFHIFEQAAARWVSRRQSEFDIIQACELPTFVATAKGIGVKTPIVMRLTAPNYVDTNGGLSRADAVIASGATMAHVSAGPRVDCVNVPNGVDTELFRPHQSDFRFRTGIGDGEFVVLYVARFQDFKNHILLLNAFGILLKAKPDCRLVLVGSGPLEKRTRNHAERLGISERIIFMGEVDFSSLPGVYAAADVMAISSDFESFCFAALEAMASGLPVVTTDCGWVPKLVGEKGGVVVPLRDPEAFANALKTLADDGDRRSRMGVFNRAKAEAEHGWPASAKRLLCVYERLLQDQSVKR